MAWDFSDNYEGVVLSLNVKLKKLSESLETTTAKLEESKQLLKTNENGENALQDPKILQPSPETRTLWLRF